MSELINKSDNRVTIRWKLLTGASALALTAYVSSDSIARAEDGDRPQIWIELGGGLSRLDDSQEAFSPAFLAHRPAIFEPSQPLETPPRYSIDEFAAVSFQPENSDWIFSASIRYGRSRSKRDLHQQTNPTDHVIYFSGRKEVQTKPVAKFADTANDIGEAHTIVDFQAGKDVGLGMLGIAGASSALSVGVRFAQFSSGSNIALKSDPDAHPQYLTFPFKTDHGNVAKVIVGGTYHSNAGALAASRSFHGIGPSLSWSASAPFAGDIQNGQLGIDWGANAAILFGRQKTRVHHQTTARYHQGKYPGTRFPTPRVTLYQRSGPTRKTRSRMVAVPNIGGFAGLSLHYQNAKLSFGYKVDEFFGAMDGGINAQKSESRSFYGPFASISIGIGE
jgi:hypothetical protein